MPHATTLICVSSLRSMIWTKNFCQQLVTSVRRMGHLVKFNFWQCINRNIYMSPPPDLCPDHVVTIQRASKKFNTRPFHFIDSFCDYIQLTKHILCHAPWNSFRYCKRLPLLCHIYFDDRCVHGCDWWRCWSSRLLHLSQGFSQCNCLCRSGNQCTGFVNWLVQLNIARMTFAATTYVQKVFGFETLRF